MSRTRLNCPAFCVRAFLLTLVFWPLQSHHTNVHAQELENTTYPSTDVGSDDPLNNSRQKAIRYHQTLRTRPGARLLFDRFYEAWLESASLAELEMFLQKQATDSQSWEDQAIFAFLQVKKRDPVRAIQWLEAALQQAPTQAYLWCEKARLSAEVMNYDQAMLDLERAAATNAANDRDRELQLLIVRQQTTILVSRGELTAAFATWSQLLDSHPHDDLLFEDIIDQQIRLGAWDQALSTSGRLLELTKDPYQLVTRRMRHGTILHQSGQSSTAIELYAETLNLVGRDSWQERELISRIRQQYQQRDDIVGLRDCWKSLLIADPDRVALRCELADAHQQLGQIEESIAIWQHIVAVTPGERRYRESLIAALVVGGRLKMAVPQLESLIEHFPDDANLLMQLANYQQQLGQVGLVGNIMDRFLEQSNHIESAYIQVAKHFEQHGPSESVRHSLERGITKNPDSNTLKDRLASWFYNNDHKPTAVQQWQTRAAAADETERMRLARLLIGLGEYQAAQDMLLNFVDDQNVSSQYLGLLIDVSIERQEFEQVVPWLRRNAARSDSWSTLEPTTQQALVVVRKLATPSIILDAFGGSALESNLNGIENVNVGVACVVARLLIHEGQYGDAKILLDALDDYWSQLPADNTRSMEMVLNQRMEYFRHFNDNPAMLATLQRLVKLPTGRRPQYFAKLVDLAIRANRLDEALQATRQWKQTQTTDSTAWILESQLLNRLQRRSESLEELRAAVTRFPQDLTLVQLLAEQCVEQGLPIEAEHLYWRLFDRSSDPKTRLQFIRPLTMLDGRENSNSRVEKILQGRIATNPESLDLQLALAEFYSLTGRSDKQKEILQWAKRKHPNNMTVLNQAVALALQQGQWDAAIEALTRIHELSPFGPPTWQLIELYLHTGQLNTAVELIREFLISHKSSPREVEAVVFRLVEREQWEMARQLNAAVLLDWEQDWRLRYLLGCLRIELGEYGSAKEDFVGLLTSEKEPIQVAPRPPFFIPTAPQVTDPNMSPTLQWLLALQELQPYLDRSHVQAKSFSGTLLPIDPHECNRLALLQLMSLMSQQFVDSDDVLATIHLEGSPNLQLIYEVLYGNYQTLEQHEALHQKYADDDDFYLARLYLGRNQWNPQQLLEVANRFQRTYPTAAFLAWDEIRQTDPEADVDFVRGYEALQGLESVEIPDRRLVERLIRLLLQINILLVEQSSSDQPHVTAQYQAFQTAAEALLLRWKPVLAAWLDDDGRRLLVKIELRQFTSGSDLSPLLQRIEQDMAGSTIWSDRFLRQGKGGSPADLPIRITLTWQGLGHSAVVPSVFLTYWYGLMDLEDESLQRVGESPGKDLGPVPWVVQLQEQIGQIQNPLLKLALLIEGQISELEGRRTRTEDEIEQELIQAQTMLSEWREQEPGSFDANILSASLAMYQNRWRDAADLIDALRHAPLSSDHRHLANAFLLDIGCQVASNDKLSSQDKSYVSGLAADAARRFTSLPLTPPQQSELLDSMLALGLTHEANKYKLANAQVNVPVSSLERLDRSTSMTPLPFEVMQAKLRRQTEQAKKLWLNRFRASVQHQLHLPLNQHYVAWIEDLRSEYSKVDLVTGELPRLIAAMERTPASAALVAVAYDVEGSLEQALDAYREVLQELPALAPIRLRISALESILGGRDLRQNWQEIPELDRLRYAEALLNWSVDSNAAPEIVFNILKATIDELESNPLAATKGATCLDLCLAVCAKELPLSSLASSTQVSSRNAKPGWTINQPNLRLPSIRNARVRLRLLGVNKAHSLSERERDLIDIRWGLFQRLSQLAIRQAKKDDGLRSYLHACALHGQKPAEWLFEEALALLSFSSRSRPMRSSNRNAYAGHWGAQQLASDAEQYQMLLQGFGGHWHTIENPAALCLAIQLVQKHPDNRPAIDAILHGWTTQFGATAVHEIDIAAQLLLVPREQFSDLALRFMNTEYPPAKIHRRVSFLEVVLHIAQSRDLVAETVPVLLAAFDAHLLQTTGQNQCLSAMYAAVCDHLAARGDMGTARTAMRDLGFRLLGPTDQEQIKRLAQFRNNTAKPIHPRQFSAEMAVHNFQVGMTHLVTVAAAEIGNNPRISNNPERLPQTCNPRGLVMIFEERRRLGFDDAASFGKYFAGMMRAQDSFDSLADAYGEFTFWHDVQRFDFSIPLTTGAEPPRSLWYRFASELEFKKPYLKFQFLTLLASRRNSRLGDRLLAAWLKRTTKGLPRSLVLEALEPDLETIQAMPAERLREIADFVDQFAKHEYHPLLPRQLSDRGRQCYELLQPYLGEHAERQRKLLLERPDWNNTSVPDSAVSDWCGEYLTPLLLEDPQRFLLCFRQIINSRQSNSWKTGTPSQHCLRAVLELDDCANAIPATLQIISDANSGSYDCLELLEWLMVRRFKPLADSESFRNDPETARDHFLSMNAQLANWPTDDLKAHYFVPFTVFVSQLEDHQRQAIREWLQSSHSQTLEPLMAEQWLMALDLAAALAAASSVEPTEPPITLAQARDRLLTHVGNDNSNMNYRCATSLLWLYSNRDWTNPSAATCCNVLQRVVEQDHPSNPAWTNRLLWQWSKLQDIHSIAKVANGLVEANCSSFTRTYVNLLDVERTAAVMTLLYRWDRRAELAKLMRDCRKSELLVHVQACAIQAGHHEVILQQLPQTLADSTVWRNWDEYFDTPFDRTIEFNEQFAAELKLFLSKIEDPGTRLLAEVYFSSVPDPIESPEPGTEPRPLRLHRLAEQYPTTTFGSFHEKFQARRILSRFGKL